MGQLLESFQEENENAAEIKALAASFEEVVLQGKFNFQKIAENFVNKINENEER